MNSDEQRSVTKKTGNLDSDIDGNQLNENSYELSPTQLGMLIHSFGPASGAYIQQLVCSLTEDLNRQALEKAWQHIVNRHAVFRTSFHLDASAPFQRVHPQVKLVIATEDWRGMTAESQKEALASYLAADRHSGFQLNEAPQLRVAVFRIGDARYEMVWTSHHAVMDGRSRRLVLSELFALYDGYSNGSAVQLPQLRPYRDYIDWLKGYDLAAAEAFWQKELRDFTAPIVLDLGGRRAQRKDGPTSHATEEISLSEIATSKLKQFAASVGVTLNTLVQASWSVLMNRYTGHEDIVFGTTRACRRSTIAGAESMVGLFINTLPVRVRVSSKEPLVTLLQRLRALQIAVREVEHTPLSKIQEWSEIPRGTAMFESLVVFENYQLNQTFESAGEKWKARKFRLFEQANYPLVLNAYNGNELLLRLEYDAARFDPSAIKRMLGHLTTLLQGMIDNPQLRIGDLPLLNEKERHQLLIEWQGSRNEISTDACIHNLVEQQAERIPDDTALVFEAQQLSYAELNSKANQLANHLRTLGVGPEVLVGICVERSPLMVIGLLAILKAGGAYVPLDPAYPQERLRFILEDTAAPLILTQRNLLATVAAGNTHTICLDEWAPTDYQKDSVPSSGVMPDNLSHVIYTSGSTGKPKGVAIEHRSVVALVNWASEVFTPAELQGVLASTSISFDLSVFEIFVTLCLGGRVILAENALHLAKLTAGPTVTLINTVPSAVTELLNARAIPTSVTTINLAGEPLKTSLVRQIYELPHVKRVLDLYGPSEDTTYSTFVLRRSDGPATIGCPISNTQIYLLDAEFRLVPPGVAAQIYLGGDGLSRGYVNRPDLTAEKFLPNPFDQRGSTRLYKTGDLARHLEDGSLEYLGRVDHQVKLRGFRIELGEVETVLGRHPDVRECAVVVSGDSIDKVLVAYVVAKKGRAPTPNALRAFLQEQLPSYMLPAKFVSLNAMPLTRSGKLDRRALPEPDRSTPGSQSDFVAPRSPLEEKLAEIWASLLRLDQVGVHDNFFELGGHSLLATKAIARIRDAFQVELPLRDLFESPTVSKVAEFVREAEKEKVESMPAIKALPRHRRPSK